MNIVAATPAQLDACMAIYARARRFMLEQGNEQWGDSYPERTLVARDIAEKKLFLCMEGEQIACVFFYAQEEDPDYVQIDGAWLNDAPYAVVHRIASAGGVRGAAAYCLNWAFAQSGNVRIDTYTANKPMQSLLQKCGFRYCGTFARIGMTWMAYQRA